MAELEKMANLNNRTEHRGGEIRKRRLRVEECHRPWTIKKKSADMCLIQSNVSKKNAKIWCK